MNTQLRGTLLAAATLAAALAFGSVLTLQEQQTAAPATAAQLISKEDAQAIAQEAYIYLYPLVLMDITRKQFTNVDPAIDPMGGPTNAFAHIRAFPTSDMRAVVRP